MGLLFSPHHDLEWRGVAEMLYQSFLHRDNQECKVNIQQRFLRAAASRREIPAAFRQDMLLPEAQQPQNGATQKACPSSAASHLHTQILVPQMQCEVTPGKEENLSGAGVRFSMKG